MCNKIIQISLHPAKQNLLLYASILSFSTLIISFILFLKRLYIFIM